MPSVHVHFLPTLLQPVLGATPGGVEAFHRSSVVVIDVLRASTTIIHALAAGARQVIPVESVERLRVLKKGLPTENVLTGGERHGVKIEGFDLDNSPFHYDEATVRGQTILFTTTNGTRALAAAHEAHRILIGAFVNRRAIVDALVAGGGDVHLLCAGTDGIITAEDCLFAGAVAGDLVASGGFSLSDDASTLMAREFAAAQAGSPDGIRKVLRESRGGTNLLELGFERDVDRCAEQDLFRFAPVWDGGSGAIRLPNGGTASQVFQI